MNQNKTKSYFKICLSVLAMILSLIIIVVFASSMKDVSSIVLSIFIIIAFSLVFIVAFGYLMILIVNHFSKKK